MARRWCCECVRLLKRILKDERKIIIYGKSQGFCYDLAGGIDTQILGKVALEADQGRRLLVKGTHRFGTRGPACQGHTAAKPDLCHRGTVQEELQGQRKFWTSSSGRQTRASSLSRGRFVRCLGDPSSVSVHLDSTAPVLHCVGNKQKAKAVVYRHCL